MPAYSELRLERPRGERGVRGVRMVPVKIRLEQVDQPTPQDMVIGPKGELPLFEGQDRESLICQGCGQEVTSGVSALTMMSLFRPPDRLLFHCSCGAFSVVGDSKD